MDLDQVKSYNEDVAKLREQRDADYAEYEKAGRIWGLVPRERITKIKFPRVKKEIIDRYYAHCICTDVRRHHRVQYFKKLVQALINCKWIAYFPNHFPHRSFQCKFPEFPILFR